MTALSVRSRTESGAREANDVVFAVFPEVRRKPTTRTSARSCWACCCWSLSGPS